MGTMNLATQKRLGVLPKTEDTLTYEGHIYGNNQRPFVGRKPTPTANDMPGGFFGVHGFGAAHGDGKLHYFGDGPGQADLPMNGFYGIGSVDLEYQAAEMLIRDPAENLPTNPAGIYGKTHAPRPLLGAVSFISGLWVMNNGNDASKLVGLPLIGLGLYQFATSSQ